MASIDKYWFIKNGEIGLVEKSANATTIQGVSSSYVSPTVAGTDNVKVHYIGRPVAMDGAVSTISTLPATYHKYLVAKVIAEGYKDPRRMDLATSQFFDAEFEKGVIRGRKEGKREYRSTGMIKPVDF